jgi:hypothetical protein
VAVFSVVDVVGVLTDSDYQTGRKYWKVLKGRLKDEGSQLATNCYQLKMTAPEAQAQSRRKSVVRKNRANGESVVRIPRAVLSSAFKDWTK